MGWSATSSDPDDPRRAFLWDSTNRIQDLGLLPGGTSAAASDINDNGLVAGTADYPMDDGAGGTVLVGQAVISRPAHSEVGQLTASGKGETEPLVSESDEASRAINRRVEILCP